MPYNHSMNRIRIRCFIKNGVILLFFLLPSVSFTQITIKRYTTATDTFYWKKYEQVREPKKVNLKHYTVSGANSLIELFLASNLHEFQQFTNDSTKRHTLKELKRCLYAVDLNNDKLADIIFTGFSGGESDITRIFINQGSSFKLVFEDYQYIVSMNFTDNMLTRIKTADVGCCDAYLYFIREFTIRHTSGDLEFIKGKQTAEYSHNQRPAGLLKTPVSWESRENSILIRASAALLNDPFNPDLNTYGNIVAGFKQKIRGTILAVQKGSNGEEFFYVEIFPGFKPEKSIFYDIEKYPTFIRGWVDSFDVKTNPGN